jgi:hypothetical protein
MTNAKRMKFKFIMIVATAAYLAMLWDTCI